MLIVNSDGTVQLTRGDTAKLVVTIMNELDGTIYTMQPEDILTLSVKKNVKETTYAFQKVVQGNTTIDIYPEDTAELQFTKYMYDVQLTTASGEVFTVITPTTFEITSEVTW